MDIKHGIKRKIFQIAAFGFSNAHMLNFKGGRIYEGKWKNFCSPGLNCYSCPAASLSCPIGALQAVNGSVQFNFSFYVTGLLLAFGVLFGRGICGWFCPFGLFQELLHKIPVPKIKLWKGFLYIKYIILVVFVLVLPVAVTNFMGMGKPAFCQYICPAGTLEGGMPLLATHHELRQVAGKLFSLKVFILIATVICCIFIYRFFCKALCPLGAIYGIMNKVSIYHIEADQHKCINCGKCKEVCKMEVNPVEKPDSAECIRCGDCVQACPEKALYLGFKTYNKKEKAHSTVKKTAANK